MAKAKTPKVRGTGWLRLTVCRPPPISFSADERRQFDRVDYRPVAAAYWRCTGCLSDNVVVLGRTRLAACGCGKVVVIRRKAGPK